MKNKKNIYVLIPAVTIIWGIIGYKIYGALNPDDEYVNLNNNLVKFEPNPPPKKDTFTVKANYRDPFLGKLQKSVPKKTNKSKTKQVKPVVQFPQIVYNGMVAPKELGKQALFLLTINNKQQLLSIGKDVEGVKLLKGNSNEITISFLNTKKTISIKQ